MKIIKLCVNENGQSHFIEEKTGYETIQPLGQYSKKISATGIMFREFEAGAIYDWHNAPQPQYIIYLEGIVEVETSSGEIKQFQAGDVLFANDLTGDGHITRTLTKGKSIIITTK